MPDTPTPTFSFTIPSLHHDTSLECRIYSPRLKAGADVNWCTKGAILAHPYAPLGGCYDDPVILAVVEEMLKRDVVVGTFNFRGAGRSDSNTSWTGKAELQDYISFTGLFVYYLHYLHTLLPYTPNPELLTVILGGYSYGSLIATHLPTLPHLLSPFTDPSPGTAASEILLRAHHLAEQWQREEEKMYAQNREQMGCSNNTWTSNDERLKAPGPTIVMGGDESPNRPSSHEGRRSMDVMRRSMERSRRRLGSRKGQSDLAVPDWEDNSRTESEGKAEGTPAPSFMLDISYLLLSPLLPPLSNMLVMSSLFSSRHGHNVDDKLADRPTLVVYGDGDVFSSQRKSKRWVEGLKGREGSRLRFEVVAGAGHFWREEGVLDELLEAVSQWVWDIML